MLAYGVIGHRHAYLRDPWCQLDFLVVTTAWLPYVIADLGNLTGLRAIRALPAIVAAVRPGMPMPSLPSCKRSASSGPSRRSPIFVMIIFGILGQGMFPALHYHCSTLSIGSGGSGSGVSSLILSAAAAAAAALA